MATTLALLVLLAAPLLAQHEHAHESALLGPYPPSREASGTSWQPDAAPHEGLHLELGGWRAMLHGFATLGWDRQGGPRGASELLHTSMLMVRADRPAGPGRLALRAMLSAEPAVLGRDGYALLLQTGESSDGKSPLVDRQHPHDLFMELSASYSIPLGEEASVFLYAGLPGEPALGPPAFMHRFSGAEFPEAPLGHHWQDSTHIAYGVATLGAVAGPRKLEVSAFHGREPDHRRYGIETPRLDSWSARLSRQWGDAWSLQASAGRLESPEALTPGLDTVRLTASASVHGSGPSVPWQATLLWGRNIDDPGDAHDAFLVEAAARRGRWTWLGRAERVSKEALFFPPDPRSADEFDVGKLTAGTLRDIGGAGPTIAGVGASVSVHILPSALRPTYGNAPASFFLWTRLRLGR